MKKIDSNFIIYEDLFKSNDLKKCYHFHKSKRNEYLTEFKRFKFEVLKYYEHLFIEDSVLLFLGSYIANYDIKNDLHLIFYRIYKANQIKNNIFTYSSILADTYLYTYKKDIPQITYYADDLINFKLNKLYYSFHMNSLKKQKHN